MDNATNNEWFGPDSFDLQGNHNQKVDMRKEVAQERGADWVVMNNSAIVGQTQSFTLDVGFEPFVLTPFWMKWHVTNFALPLTTLPPVFPLPGTLKKK